MATSRSAPQAAFVLHQWDWSETSLILDLFTRDQGRLAAVAKGATLIQGEVTAVVRQGNSISGLTLASGETITAPMRRDDKSSAAAATVLPGAMVTTACSALDFRICETCMVVLPASFPERVHPTQHSVKKDFPAFAFLSGTPPRANPQSG